MSLNVIPPKIEVMGWSPQRLADYLKRLQLTGCDRVVMQGSISGAQFTNMTDIELEVFPNLYIPIITKIQSDINKGEQKKSVCSRLKSQMSPNPVLTQHNKVWDTNEYDISSDNDYESPGQEEEAEDNICAFTEPGGAEQLCSGNVKKPAGMVKPPRPLRPAQPKDSQRADEKQPRPPVPPRVNPTLPRPFKAATAGQPIPRIDRSRKPEPPLPFQKETPQLKGSANVVPGKFTNKVPEQKNPKPPDVSNRTSKVLPSPPVATELTKDLDPSWYGGMLSRHQGEVVLRELNKDGAFIVRDSSKCSPIHPYTLMILNQGKIYNIKIRNQGNSYSLGNGLSNTKSFPGVKEMITHHTHMPLLLIDATDQQSEEQAQCCLQHPAAL